MRPREPRLRDETGAEIDMTTGERRPDPCAFEISGRWFSFSFSPGAVAYCGEPINIPVTLGSILDSEPAAAVKHGPVDDYGGCITMDMPAPGPIGPVVPHEGDGWFNPKTNEYRRYRADLQMWVSAAEYVGEASPVAVVPLPDVLLADGDSLSFSMEIDESGKAHLTSSAAPTVDPPASSKHRGYLPDLVAAWVERDVVPLSGATKCARYPALPCPHDCEFGISGPCIIDIEDA